MQLTLSPDDLRPVIQAVVAEMLARLPLDDGRDAYSPSEVATRLGASIGCVKSEIALGRLFTTRVGRKARISKAQLAAYLAAQQNGGDDDA